MPTLEKNETHIYYESYGNSLSPALILINGYSGQLINWPPVFIQNLVKAGFFVISFDNRDVGLSSYYDHLGKPNLSEVLSLKQQGLNFEAPYSLNDMAADIIILMDQLNIKKAHIVGISMGGQIAQVLALEHSEHVLSLTCIQTSSGDPKLPPPKQEVIDLFFNTKPATDLCSYLSNCLKFHKTYNTSIDIDEDTTLKFYENAYLRAYHPEGNMRQLLAMIAAEPRHEKLKSLAIPCLILHGDQDPVFPIEHAKQLAECIKDSQLHIIENMGHGFPQRVHDLFANLIARHIL